MSEPTYSTAVRELPPEERPRERLARLGPEALRDAELLAILFRTGTRDAGAVALADRVVHHFTDLRGLARASVDARQNRQIAATSRWDGKQWVRTEESQ